MKAIESLPITVVEMAITTRPTLDCSEPSGTYVTTMEIVGTVPITYNPGATKRESYRAWIAALDAAARDAAARARPTTAPLFSLRCELRLYTPYQGSDLDNYVKPIQDALALHGLLQRRERRAPAPAAADQVSEPDAGAPSARLSVASSSCNRPVDSFASFAAARRLVR